jgi:hypothetical protein
VEEYLPFLVKALKKFLVAPTYSSVSLASWLEVLGLVRFKAPVPLPTESQAR